MLPRPDLPEYEILAYRDGYMIVDRLGLRALEVSNKLFPSEAEAQQVIDEHRRGIRKGHWKPIKNLLTDSGEPP